MTRPSPIAATLGRLASLEDLSQEETSAAIDAVMQGIVEPGQIGLLLTLLREKGETVEEVAGAAQALRRHMTRIPTSRTGVVDTCGTGGDASGTFNISTAAAIVAAAAGVPVAKHGNRKITSRTGSADVLTALGVNVAAEVSRVAACLDDLGLCFCFAPLLHGAMKNVAEVRRTLGFTTIFNLLGPLTNPAGAEFQLLGAGKPHLRTLLAASLERLGTKRALVVCGADGLDEVTLAGVTHVSRCGAGWETEAARTFEWRPEDFGLGEGDLASLRVEGPEQSAAVIRGVLAGETGPARDIVVLNAAAAILVAVRSPSPQAAAALAAEAIDSGAARELLAKLAKLTSAA